MNPYNIASPIHTDHLARPFFFRSECQRKKRQSGRRDYALGVELTRQTEPHHIEVMHKACHRASAVKVAILSGQYCIFPRSCTLQSVIRYKAPQQAETPQTDMI